MFSQKTVRAQDKLSKN